MIEAPLQLQRLHKAYGVTVAVDGLDLAVAGGEIYGLLGPNGAGKTTALRALAGLVAPSAGRALVMGVDPARAPETARRRLGYMSGATGLYPRLTPRELLSYFGGMFGLSPRDVAARIASLAAALEMERFLDRRCEALSTGERQRVSIARATLHDPPVLVLDEPTAGLDVLASRFLRDFVRAERARGKAILFSTHYLAEAELLCDRVGLLHRGALLAEGAPAALRARSGAASLEEAFLAIVEGGAARDARGEGVAPAGEEGLPT